MTDHKNNIDGRFLEKILNQFYRHVVWPIIKNLIQEWETPAAIFKIKDELGAFFLRKVLEKLDKSKSGQESKEIRESNEEEILDIFPSWIQRFIIEVFTNFSENIVSALSHGTDGLNEIKNLLKVAIIVNLFNTAFWGFVYSMFKFNTHLSISVIAEIRDKIIEFIKSYATGEISLSEVKNTIQACCEEYNIEGELTREIITSFIKSYFEIINNLKIDEIDEFLATYIANKVTWMNDNSLFIDEKESNEEVVKKWFFTDIFPILINNMKHLFPEFDDDIIKTWREEIERNLDLLINNMLTYEDFEKRAINIFKSPRLTFDIEKVDNEEEDLVGEFINIEERGSILQSLLACIEMIYVEVKEDPLLENLAKKIKQMNAGRERLYL
ncbi:MAG: hypothetical protein ACTSVI_03585 [Promethearchaeota archaeon]